MSPQQQLARYWLTFGIASLGVSTLFALLLIGSRTPGVGTLFPHHDFFYSALALHVNLSAIVWVLAASSALLIWLSPPQWLRLVRIALGAGIAGSIIMALSPLIGSPIALKNNYVPVLNSGTFLTGLTLVATAVFIIAVRSLCLLKPWAASDSERPKLLAAYGGAIAIVLAGITTAWVISFTPTTLDAASYFEQIFWAPGHVLQNANMLFMLLAWLWLAQYAGLLNNKPNWNHPILLLGVLPLIAVPILLLMYAPDTPGFRQGFTEFMRWGSWLVALPFGLWLLWQLRHNQTLHSSERTGLKLSIWLFLLGIIIGSLIRNDNVMVPAHYHGTIGAVTLALMTICLHFLPQLDLNPVSAPLARWPLRLYGLGTLLMASGLAISGWLGLGRKLPGDVQAASLLENTERIVAMSFAGLGGTLAVIGSILFVVSALNSLLKRTTSPKRNSEQLSPQEEKSLGLALTLFCMLIPVIAVIALTHDEQQQIEQKLANRMPSAQTDPDAHIAAGEKQQVAIRFQQAIDMMRVGEYNYAVVALESVLKMRPNMPEAHVNMGYALLNLKEYKAAAQHFDHATQIRPMQFNAYYGMAEALYELGDLEAALGAMRSYVHLAPKDDKFLVKANAAIWEWEEQLKLKQQINQTMP